MAARRRAAPKKSPRAPKREASPSSGGGLPRALIVFAIVVGIGYAVIRLPVGDSTVAESTSLWIQKQFRTRPRPMRLQKAREQVQGPADTSGELEQDRKADHRKAMARAIDKLADLRPHDPTATGAPDQAADGSHPPADAVTAEDRKALDALLR